MQQEVVDEITATTRAWSPQAIGWICFFFSFLPAGVMYAINYERLGYPEKKRKYFLYVVVGFIAYVVAAMLLPDFPGSRGLFSGINIAATFSFYRSQKKLFEQHIQRGGGKAPIGVPLALSFLWIVLFAGVVFGLGYLEITRDNGKFNYAVNLFNSGEYEKAEPVFKIYQTKYPEEPATYLNLTMIYLHTNRLEMAKREIKELLRREPNHSEAKAMLSEIEETLSQKSEQLIDKSTIDLRRWR